MQNFFEIPNLIYFSLLYAMTGIPFSINFFFFIPLTTMQFPAKKTLSFMVTIIVTKLFYNNNAFVLLFIFLYHFLILSNTPSCTGCIVYVGVKFVNKFATVALLCVIFSIIAVYTGIFTNIHGNDKLK